MLLTIETILKLYMLLCSGMILFNLLIAFYNKHESKMIKYRNKKLEQTIDIQIRRIAEGKKIEESHKKYLAKKLKRKHYLAAFHYKVGLIMPIDNVKAIHYIQEIKDVLGVLAVEYSKQGRLEKTYFAYILSQYPLINRDTIQFLFQSVISPSIFERENALLALYRQEEAENILLAYKAMKRNNIEHHQKLLSDGLCEFVGDKELLGRILFRAFEEMNLNQQIAIVNYAKIMKLSYPQKLYEIMIDTAKAKELRLVCMRYFGKNKYTIAKQTMIEWLDSEEEIEWEYLVNAARELRNYPAKDTTEALRKALAHTSWHVRFNAAESLCEVNEEDKILTEKNFENNPYGEEILQYMKQKQLMRLGGEEITYERIS